jgi:hypothetical protein
MRLTQNQHLETARRLYDCARVSADQKRRKKQAAMAKVFRLLASKAAKKTAIRPVVRHRNPESLSLVVSRLVAASYFEGFNHHQRSAARPHFLVEIIRWARWTISSFKSKGGTAPLSGGAPKFPMSRAGLAGRSLQLDEPVFLSLKKLPWARSGSGSDGLRLPSTLCSQLSMDIVTRN